MDTDIRELKKNAFLRLRDDGYTFDEIRRIMNVSERTLYNWQNEITDVEETEPDTVDIEIQKEIGELQEHIQDHQQQIKNLRVQLENKKTTEQIKAEKEIAQFLQKQREADRLKDQKRQLRVLQIQKFHKISEKNASSRDRERMSSG